jgi:phosphatidylethanolamine/phosphatidyl-N-methylethanolamine N-methyltransferase
VIERNILKAKTFINQSFARVAEAGSSQASVGLVQKSSLIGNQGKQPLASWMLFAREALRNPRAIGTVFESSTKLAREIAQFVPLNDSGLILELGGGTGKVTEALLKRGLDPERLVSVELSGNLANYLHKRFPKVRIIKGDALHLCKLLGNDAQRVSTIVSGLPFRSLPHPVGQGIIKQIAEILPENGLLIQFTYDLSGQAPSFLHHHFKAVSHKIVWSNLPPARVNVYQLIQE